MSQDDLDDLFGDGFDDDGLKAMDKATSKSDAEVETKRYRDKLRGIKKREDQMDQLKGRSTRKGFLVLMALMAIAAWFMYYYVLNQNTKVFFVLVLVGLVIGGYAFFNLVYQGGAQTVNAYMA